MTDPTPEERPAGLLGRITGMQGRTKLLIAVGLALVLVSVFAPQSCGGRNVEEEQAIATASAALAAEPDAFAPDKTEAKLLRQGFPARLMWVVVFTVDDPEGGPEDFLHKADIWVNANTGDLEQVIVHKPDEE
ncbi:MAG: hypothetical protein F4118_03530 [Acidimicrobiaceae bacterium]|nr:hypothetical protein [Acidimicrobiaceae bacterium]MYI14515.1 hypothetical protein [Acidimicrobiaceae bacterium]MYI35484.1 hypothetical protein [Acidimicrobiaceae bacterium]